MWPAFATAALAAAALATIDFRTHRLPDAITLPATAFTAALFWFAAWRQSTPDLLTRAAAGSLVMGAAYLALHWASRGSLGFGDVKLALLLGLPAGWIGWDAVLLALVLPFALGGIAALALLVTRRATLQSQIAFGPFMVLGALLAASLSPA